MCDGCGGRHWLRECTTTSTRMKERIWTLKAESDVDNSTSGAKDNRRSIRPRRDICASCFGAHTVGRCPIPGRLHWHAANWPGMGCFGCGGNHPPHGCQWVAHAIIEPGWEQIFRRMWCFGCGGRHPLRGCTGHSPTDKDRIWEEVVTQYCGRMHFGRMPGWKPRD
jgi:hypothetical protein